MIKKIKKFNISTLSPEAEDSNHDSFITVGKNGLINDLLTKTDRGGVEGEPAKVKFIQDVVIGLVVVLFIGFTTMFVATATVLYESWTNKAATYEDLENKITEQNNKIDFLFNQSKQNAPTP
jgi:hypothetical protein